MGPGHQRQGREGPLVSQKKRESRERRARLRFERASGWAAGKGSRPRAFWARAEGEKGGQGKKGGEGLGLQARMPMGKVFPFLLFFSFSFNSKPISKPFKNLFEIF